MLTEINIDNAIWREPVVEREFWVAKNVDDSEPENYPVDVLDVDGNVIGTANDKEEYISIWNANADNRATMGYLIGWELPFVFEIVRGKETTSGALIDENDEFILSGEDGEILIGE